MVGTRQDSSLPKFSPIRLVIVSAESMAEGFAPHAHVTDISKAFSALGHDVKIVGEDSGSYHVRGLFRRLSRYVTINRRAVSAMSQCDAMLARGHFANLPWAVLAKLRGITVVHEMNGLMFDAAATHRTLRFAQGMIGWSYRKQFSIASGIACVTAEIARHVQSIGIRAPVSVISNGVDTTMFFADSDASRASDYAIFPSALAPWHGIETLMAALDDPDWPRGLRLVLAGDGVQANTVRAAALKDSRITYLGLLPRFELAVHMRKAAIGLCLVESLKDRGITEIVPLKLFEMMASGLPVVATDAPGQRDIVLNAEAGLLVKAGDSKALAKAVKSLFENKQRSEMGLRGQSSAQSFHDWRFRAIALESLVREAMVKSTTTPVG
jgi:glycosyltransferase involved in cell wall biosynthesis